MECIAKLYNDFPTKFGVPRQSSLSPSLISRIEFEPEFRNPDAVRGLEGFSHLWLIWEFSQFRRDGEFSPTVRPPRLGGNDRLGVFATRSPNRPNPIGLSCVKLEAIEYGPVLVVSGADLCSGTPIYDIKPYIPTYDSHPDATEGFLDSHPRKTLKVKFGDEYCDADGNPYAAAIGLSDNELQTLEEILALDPRPAYHNDPQRIYGLPYAGLDVHFRVADNVLLVTSISRL